MWEVDLQRKNLHTSLYREYSVAKYILSHVHTHIQTHTSLNTQNQTIVNTNANKDDNIHKHLEPKL